MQSIIESVWNDRSLLSDEKIVKNIESIIEQLDKGIIRVAEPAGNEWQVNDWVKKAVIMYFQTRQMETLHAGILEFNDKMKLNLIS